MTNTLAERIACICDELKKEIKKCINETDSENQSNYSESNLNISIQVESISHDIANEFMQKEESKPATTDVLLKQKTEIKQIKESIERISDELQKQTNHFYNEIDKEKKKAEKKENSINQNYKENFKKLIQAHKNELADLQNQLDDLKITFDSRILEEKSNAITKKMVLKQTYDSFQADYDSMRSDLEKKLKEANQQISDLEDEISIKYGPNIKQINELEEQINKSKAEKEEELSKIEKENQSLQSQIDSIKKENDTKIQNLQQKIEEEQNNFESQLADQLKINQPKFDSEIQAIHNKYNALESELNEKLETAKNSRSDQSDFLQSELMKLKSQVNSIDSKIAKKLKIARTQLESKIIAKDAEIKQLRSDNKKFIESTKQSYQTEINRIKNDNESQLVILEQSLMKTVANANQQSKPKFNVKLPSGAPKAPLQTARRIRQPSHRSPDKISKDMSHSINSGTSAVESIEEHFEASQEESKKRNDEFASIKKKAENDIRINRAKASAQINELDKATKAIQEEIEILKNQIKEEEEKINQNLDSTQNSESSEICEDPKRAELLGNIEQQKLLIQQLKEDRDRLRVDPSKFKTLQALHAKLRKDKNEIEDNIKNASQGADFEIDKIYSKMEVAYQEEVNKTEKLIQESSVRLELMLKELVDDKMKSEEINLNNSQKWNELRSGIADSTLSICKKLNASGSSSSSKLPPLKK